MYYEFKVSNANSVFPPYTNNCPDYSYEYNDPKKGTVCKFNDSFRNNYSEFVTSAFKNKSDSNSFELCGKHLMCDYGDGKGVVNCNNTATIPTNMYYVPIKGNSKYNIRKIRNCHLTLDGIV